MLGLVLIIVYMSIFASKYEINKVKLIPYTIFCFLTMYVLMLILFWICVGHLGGQNVIRTFVFLPLIIILYSRVFDIDTKKAMDISAPAICIAQFAGKFACQYEGCCRSWLKVDWGIYNNVVQKRLFPVQLAEGITSLLITIYLIYISKKHNYNYGGLCLPWMLILFGITRFIWEFMRDNKKIIWNISELAIWCILMVIVGGIWLLVDKKKG